MTAKSFTIAASGGDYTSISGYVSGEAENLVSGGHTHDVEITTADLDDNTDMTGFTSDATNRVRCWATPTHGGDNSSTGRQINDTSTTAHTFQPVNACDGLILEGLGIKSAASIYRDDSLGIPALFENCFFETTASNQVLYLFSSGSATEIRNTFCIVTGTASAAVVRGGANIVINYCTFYNFASSNQLVVWGGVCTNVIAFQNTTPNAFFGCTGDYNLSDDTSGPGANSVDNETDTDVLADPGGTPIDLNLLNGTNNAVGAGTNISGTTTDYEGDARHATAPDIGADEWAASTLDIDADIDATGAVAGFLGRTVANDADIDATGAVAGFLGRTVSNDVAVSANGDFAQSLQRLRQLTSDIDAVSALNLDLNVIRGLNLVVAASGDFNLFMNTVLGLTETLGGISAFSSYLGNTQGLNVDIDSVSAIAGDIQIEFIIDGQIIATSSIAGALGVLSLLNVDIDAVSTIGADLLNQRGLTVDLDAVSALDGFLGRTVGVTVSIPGIGAFVSQLSVPSSDTGIPGVVSVADGDLNSLSFVDASLNKINLDNSAFGEVSLSDSTLGDST